MVPFDWTSNSDDWQLYEVPTKYVKIYVNTYLIREIPDQEITEWGISNLLANNVFISSILLFQIAPQSQSDL